MTPEQTVAIITALAALLAAGTVLVRELRRAFADIGRLAGELVAANLAAKVAALPARKARLVRLAPPPDPEAPQPGERA